MFTNTWLKLLTELQYLQIQVSHVMRNTITGDMRGGKTQTDLLSGYKLEVLIVASSTS